MLDDWVNKEKKQTNTNNKTTNQQTTTKQQTTNKQQTTQKQSNLQASIIDIESFKNADL